VLDALCYRELTRYTVSADVLHLIAEQRGAAAAELAKNIQDRADDLTLGIDIVAVSLQGIHPPVEVGQAFEDVVGAIEEKHASVLEADAYRYKEVPAAEAEAKGIELKARAYKTRRELVSKETARRFELRLGVYQLSPEVFVHRELLDALEEGLEGRRKIVKPEWADADEVIIFDLHRATRPTGFESLIGEQETGGTE